MTQKSVIALVLSVVVLVGGGVGYSAVKSNNDKKSAQEMMVKTQEVGLKQPEVMVKNKEDGAIKKNDA